MNDSTTATIDQLNPDERHMGFAHQANIVTRLVAKTADSIILKGNLC